MGFFQKTCLRGRKKERAKGSQENFRLAPLAEKYGLIKPSFKRGKGESLGLEENLTLNLIGKNLSIRIKP